MTAPNLLLRDAALLAAVAPVVALGWGADVAVAVGVGAAAGWLNLALWVIAVVTVLELTLTDTADKAIARKVLAPKDYLPPKTSSAGGMQPGSDIMVAIGVDPGEMAASGYRLYLFYP